jgi:hypothetical protein
MTYFWTLETLCSEFLRILRCNGCKLLVSCDIVSLWLSHCFLTLHLFDSWDGYMIWLDQTLFCNNKFLIESSVCTSYLVIQFICTSYLVTQFIFFCLMIYNSLKIQYAWSPFKEFSIATCLVFHPVQYHRFIELSTTSNCIWYHKSTFSL